MNEYLSLISEADAMAICLEQTKHKLELAKLSLEATKQELERVKEAYEEVLSRADEAGLSKNKLKKLVEERIQEIATLGLAEWTQTPNGSKAKKLPGATKAPRARKSTSDEEKSNETSAILPEEAIAAQLTESKSEMIEVQAT